MLTDEGLAHGSTGALFRRLVRENGGQDIVEYALLAALVALASVAVLSGIQTVLGTTYTTWDANTELLSCMPDPGGGGCP